MNYLRHFVIPFSGLKVGNYSFDFEIDDTFFEHFDYSEVRKGEVHVDCLLERHPRMMVLHFEIKGRVRVPCDRCTAEFDQYIEGRQKLIVKFGADHTEESEDILVITDKEHELDISQYLYEYIHLLLPIRKVHGNDENGNSLCDPEVIRYITESDVHAADPRWDALKKLKDQSDNQEN